MGWATSPRRQLPLRAHQVLDFPPWWLCAFDQTPQFLGASSPGVEDRDDAVLSFQFLPLLLPFAKPLGLK